MPTAHKKAYFINKGHLINYLSIRLLGLSSDVKRQKNADRFSFVVKLIQLYQNITKFDPLIEIFRYDGLDEENMEEEWIWYHDKIFLVNIGVFILCCVGLLWVDIQ